MSSDGSQSPRRKKLFAISDQIGLTREERVELAQFLLRRDVQSFKDLSEEQVARMLDAIEGWELIHQLFEMRSGAEDSEGR